MNRVLGSHARIPATIIAFPELHVPNRGHREKRHLGVQVGTVHRVEEQAFLGVCEGPQRVRVDPYLVILSFFVRIVEECTEKVGVQMVKDGR